MKTNAIKPATVFLLYFASLANGESSGQNTTDMRLELVQVLFRHGERTPLEIEHNVVNYTDLALYEPYGLGHLTNTGKNQAYQVGAMLRERYNDFLGSESYDPRQVYSYTSDNDRTIASLQLVLARLYVPTVDSTWNPRLKWLPMPYHVVPKPLDILFKSDSNPVYMKFVREVENSSEFRERMSKYSDLVELLQEKLKVDVKDGYRSIFLAHNILEINDRLNLSLPDWYTPEVNSTYINMMQNLLDRLSYTVNLKKINGGTIVRHTLENIKAESTSARRMYLYSGHDTNIAAVTRTLGLRLDKYPDFSDALIFEKYRDADARVYVKILYWDRLHKVMLPLKLDNCEDYCPIDDYAKIAGKVIPSDEELRTHFGSFDLRRIDNFFSKRFKY